MRTFRTPLGLVSVAATARGLARVVLPGPGGMATPCCCVAMCSERPHGHAKAKRDHATLAQATVNGSDPAAEAIAARAEREIREYLAGRRRPLDHVRGRPEWVEGRRFTVPLDLSGLSPFHRRVLQAARRIPYGRTATYSDLARRVGRPLAARAVGQAMARNPVPLVIPCHRVVASGGGLGGYGGGLDLKRRLLALEGARLTE